MKIKEYILHLISVLYHFYKNEHSYVSKQNFRYPNFDILRLFLALEVAYAHARWTIDNNFLWPAGIMCVPAFLGISGFLVLKSYAESGSWLIFIRKRLLRLLPALLVSFIVCYFLFDWTVAYNSVLVWLTGGLYTFINRMVHCGHLSGRNRISLLALLWMCGAYKRPFFIWLLFILSLILLWAIKDLEPRLRIIFFLIPAFFTGNLLFIYKDRFLNIHCLVPWIVFYIMTQWYFVPHSKWLGGGS